MTSLERARAVVEAWDEELRRELPENAYLFDVHTHLGNDIDGMVGGYDELTSLLDRYGFRGAFMFCLDEHDREPAFTVPNDRTLAHAERSGGKLIPFVRLDLTTQPLEEARRCLDLGARGIKLHPRAQAFALSDERLQPVFALAVERSVPILIHGGRGLPPIAEDLEALVRRNVRREAHHRARGNRRHGRSRRAPRRPRGVFFDTSVWSGLDLLDLYRQVAPEQVLYASDYPYGRQPNSLLMAVRTAKLAGFDDKQLRLMLGGSARRMIAGEELEPLSAPHGPTSLVQPLTFARIHQYISMAVPMLWLRQRDVIGALGLAVNASRERSNGHPEQSERIEELLATAQELWRAGAGDRGRRRARGDLPRGHPARQPRGHGLADDARLGDDRVHPAGGLDALQDVLAAILEVEPDPATRSCVVELTSTSPPSAMDITRAPTWTAIPAASRRRSLDLAGVDAGPHSRPSSRGSRGWRARSESHAPARRRARGSRRRPCRSPRRRSGELGSDRRRRAERGARPRRVAELRRPLGRADEVGEEDGREDAVGRPARA